MKMRTAGELLCRAVHRHFWNSGILTQVPQRPRVRSGRIAGRMAHEAEPGPKRAAGRQRLGEPKREQSAREGCWGLQAKREAKQDCKRSSACSLRGPPDFQAKQDCKRSVLKRPNVPLVFFVVSSLSTPHNVPLVFSSSTVSSVSTSQAVGTATEVSTNPYLPSTSFTDTFAT